MPTIQEVVDSARTWIGTPYVHNGRVKGVAGDCLAMLIGTGHDLNVSKFDTNEYTQRPNPKRLLAEADEVLIRQERTRADLYFGDIVLMSFRRIPMHFGIIADADKPFSLIHASAELGFCCEHRLDAEMCRKIYRIYRAAGVTYER